MQSQNRATQHDPSSPKLNWRLSNLLFISICRLNVVDAMLGGINFPPTATRTTRGGGGSSDIRRYLVTHCGMRIAP